MNDPANFGDGLEQMGVKDPPRLHKNILQHLERREVCTTKDSPVGGYGGWLVARAFGGRRQGKSNKGVDVLVPGGARLQVKARWLPLERDSRQRSAIRSLDQRGFDYLVAILLDRNFV
jgi:hypothetical protein